mmetsp:Transcript_14364/g.40042  ORF Transcript_14364/g.40042 Transcript_14364/m.40042 type:complete len:291 (-) Transcript_14364:341-1213(-)
MYGTRIISVLLVSKCNAVVDNERAQSDSAYEPAMLESMRFNSSRSRCDPFPFHSISFASYRPMVCSIRALEKSLGVLAGRQGLQSEIVQDLSERLFGRNHIQSRFFEVIVDDVLAPVGIRFSPGTGVGHHGRVVGLLPVVFYCFQIIGLIEFFLDERRRPHHQLVRLVQRIFRRLVSHVNLNVQGCLFALVPSVGADDLLQGLVRRVLADLGDVVPVLKHVLDSGVPLAESFQFGSRGKARGIRSQRTTRHQVRCQGRSRDGCCVLEEPASALLTLAREWIAADTLCLQL